jgi:hypothetical protein
MTSAIFSLANAYEHLGFLDFPNDRYERTLYGMPP